MDLSNSLISALYELTVTANKIPSGVDFGLAALDDDFDGKIKELNEIIFHISSNLFHSIVPEKPKIEYHSELESEYGKIINTLLNDPIMKTLDEQLNSKEKLNKNEIQKDQIDIETQEINGITFVFTKKEFPRPDRFYPKISPPETIPFITEIPNFGEIYENTSKFDKTEINYIDSVQELNTAAIRIQKDNVIFISTEIHRIRTYRPYPCFLMVFSPSSGLYMFDMLKLKFEGDTFRSFLQNDNVIKVFYGSENIIPIFAEAMGIFIAPAVDLSYFFEQDTIEECLLANDLFLRKCVVDWRIRPTQHIMKDIAVESVFYLPKLASIANYSPENIERMKEIQNISSKPYTFTNDDTEAMAQEIINQFGELDPIGNNLVRVLVRWRDDVAKLEDESPNFLIPNRQLWTIAKEKPTNNEEFSKSLGDMVSPMRDANKEEIYNLVINTKEGGLTNSTSMNKIKDLISKK